MKNTKNKPGGSIDTNALLRLVLGNIPEQTVKVEELLETGGTFDVADVVLFEMVFVLEKVYKLPRTQVAENIIAITHHTQMRCNRSLFELTIPLYLAQTKLSIVDCALIQYAKLNSASPLYTFDQAMAKAKPDTVKLLISNDT